MNYQKLKGKKLDLLHSDYFFLALGLGLSGAGYLLLAHQPSLQIGIIMLTGIFYILWGAIHHAREDEWHLRVLLEYVLIAALAVSLWLSLTLRA